ncbi:MAG: hypothetical protein WC307_07220 [Candidatus Nanoarchaeia archaeon]|jgi:hypothetical protein
MTSNCLYSGKIDSLLGVPKIKLFSDSNGIGKHSDLESWINAWFSEQFKRDPLTNVVGVGYAECLTSTDTFSYFTKSCQVLYQSRVD